MEFFFYSPAFRMEGKHLILQFFQPIFKCNGLFPIWKKKSCKVTFPLIFYNILKVLKQINMNEGKRKSLLSEDVQKMFIDTTMNSQSILVTSSDKQITLQDTS